MYTVDLKINLVGSKCCLKVSCEVRKTYTVMPSQRDSLFKNIIAGSQVQQHELEGEVVELLVVTGTHCTQQKLYGPYFESFLLLLHILIIL